MPTASDADVPLPLVLLPDSDRGATEMRVALSASVALHAIVILVVVFGWPWLMPAPPAEQEVAIPVNLVVWGEKTAAPSSEKTATLPQEKAPEISPTDHPEAVPIEQAPSPPDLPHETVDRTASTPLSVASTQQPSNTPRRPQGPKDPGRLATKLPRPPVPADDLNARLRKLAQLRQPASSTPPMPRQQNGTGLSNVTATSADAGSAPDATYSVKDFIRAQVERRWNPDRTSVKIGDWRVAIHILLDRDGTVSGAYIVDEARYRSDKAYMAFAFSARNAVLLSSPLALPPGAYDIAKDIVVDFDPKQVLQ